jgi:hypothetical protein
MFGVYMVRMQPLSDRIFASCSVDSDIKVGGRQEERVPRQVWDLASRKEPLLHTLDDHLGYVTCIEWIPGIQSWQPYICSCILLSVCTVYSNRRGAQYTFTCPSSTPSEIPWS